MIVAKFGGTSVNTKERILTLSQIVANQLKKQPVVVVSALRGVTDGLLALPSLSSSQAESELEKIKAMHLDLVRELFSDTATLEKISQYINDQLKGIARLLQKKTFSKAALDKLVSYGEIMSSYLISCAFEAKGIKAKQVIATDLIVTDDNFGSAEFIINSTRKNTRKILLPIIKKGILPIVTGFIGSTVNGQTTTLGRGGSDYTASIIGLCLAAAEIQIWTDVDGIFTADPKVVENARSLPVVSFKEASELATFGARVLHPRTIKPAISANIPVRVLNTANPKNAGTLIKERIKALTSIRAIAFKRKINLINIYSTEMLLQKGFLAKIFKVFEGNNLSVDLVSVSEVSVSVTLDENGSLENLIKQLSEFSCASIIKNLGMVSLVGDGITSSSLTIKKIFAILDKEKILTRMVSLGATDINISLVIESDQVEKAVKVLHKGLL